jgi:Protein of unknown function (DUF3224)
MTTRVTGTFQTKAWQETPFSEIDGAGKLTRTSMTDAFQGGIEGEATVEYLMAYDADGSASFVALGRVVGRIGDRSGSFVLQQRGTMADNKVTATWSVVAGTGTEDLRGLRGEGGYTWDGTHGPEEPYTLEYDLG